MKKSETCFTEGVDKSTEFSLYHFSNRASAWAYYNDQATGLPDFLDHPVKESRGRVSISSETRPVYVQSIYVPSILVWVWRYVQLNFGVQMSADAVIILLTGFGLTWTEGQPSHSDTLECVWLLRLSGSDGTRS